MFGSWLLEKRSEDPIIVSGDGGSSGVAVSHYPSVYLDTNILSYLHYSGREILTVARHIMTRDWWQNERRYFRLYSSKITMQELEAGAYWGQAEAVAQNRRIVFLPVTISVKELAATYLNGKLVPENKPSDALQLALATVHSVDYVLSWNHAHLTKWETQTKLYEINKSLGYRTPFLMTPDTIPKVGLGQEIKRKDPY